MISKHQYQPSQRGVQLRQSVQEFQSSTVCVDSLSSATVAVISAVCMCLRAYDQL